MQPAIVTKVQNSAENLAKGKEDNDFGNHNAESQSLPKSQYNIVGPCKRIIGGFPCVGVMKGPKFRLKHSPSYQCSSRKCGTNRIINDTDLVGNVHNPVQNMVEGVDNEKGALAPPKRRRIRIKYGATGSTVNTNAVSLPSKLVKNMENEEKPDSPQKNYGSKGARGNLGRILTEKETIKYCDQFRASKRKLKARPTLIIDNVGHIYGPGGGPGTSFVCKFAHWKTYGNICPARIYYNNSEIKQWQGWKDISHSKKCHNHPTPSFDPKNIKGSTPRGSNKSPPNPSTSASTPVYDIFRTKPTETKQTCKKLGDKEKINGDSTILPGDKSLDFEDELKLEKIKKPVDLKGNIGTKVRIMNDGQRDKCQKKFIKKTLGTGTIFVDNLGHIYRRRGNEFICKFTEWKTFGKRCPVRIQIENKSVKEWKGWIQIIRHSIIGHNHGSPLENKREIEEPQSQGSNKGQINTSTSASDFDASIITRKRPVGRPKKALKIQNSDGKSKLDNSHKIGGQITPAKKRRVETAAGKVVQKWIPREKISLQLSTDFINGDSNLMEKTQESTLMSKSTSFVENHANSTQLFDSSPILSRFASSNPISQPQLNSNPMVSCIASNFNPAHSNLPGLPEQIVTSSTDSSTQLRQLQTPKLMSLTKKPQSGAGTNVEFLYESSPAPERNILLPAWTNCKTCKACVLIDSNCTIKDLIAVAKTHIIQFHGPVKIVTKEMINQHLPNILNLRKLEQIPIIGSVLLNDEGDFECAIPNCNAEMLNMPDLKENDNDLVNHVINQHLAPDEKISNEIFWQCFPITAPQRKQANLSIVKQE